jgi:hypothetical protein
VIFALLGKVAGLMPCKAAKSKKMINEINPNPTSSDP